MKKNIMIATIVMLSLATSDDVFAQFSKVGATALTDNGVWDWTFNSATGSGFRAIRGRSNTTGTSNNGVEIYGGYNGDDGASLFLTTNANTSSPGNVEFWTRGSSSGRAFDIKYHPNSSSWNSLFSVKNNGRVGINDSDPAATLTVNGEFAFSGNYPYIRTIKGRATTTGAQNTGLEIYSSYNGDDGASLFMFSNAAATNKGATEIWSSNTTTTGHAFAVVHHPNASTWTGLFTVHNDGKVSIGNVNKNTSSPYKLYVETGILTEKIKVALSTDAVNWSDFVFADDYQLRPLNEVESFVKKNKHLPEIPSAKEVYANGLDLAQMDAKLLQKIEELTLYVIEQQREINSLKSKLNK